MKILQWLDETSSDGTCKCLGALLRKVWSDVMRCFQPGFRRSSRFRGWLPGVPPKQTKVAREEILNHSSMQFYWRLSNSIGFHEQRKHLRKVPLQQKRLKNTDARFRLKTKSFRNELRHPFVAGERAISSGGQLLFGGL